MVTRHRRRRENFFGARLSIQNFLRHKVSRHAQRRPAVQVVNALERQFKVRRARLQQLHSLKLRFSRHRLHHQNRFQNDTLSRRQLEKFAITCVRIKYRRNYQVQIRSPAFRGVFVRALLVKKIPQIIHRQQVADLRASRRYELLKTFDARRFSFDEVEHASLIGREICRDVFQHERRHRVYRQYPRQNFVGRFDVFRHRLPTASRSIFQRRRYQLPITLCRRFDFQRVPDKLKRYVVRHRDVSQNETVAQLFKRFVPRQLRHVRRDYQVKRLAVHQLNQFLKVAQIVAVALEKVSKFVPKENNGFEFVGVDDLGKPTFQVVHANFKRPNAFALAQRQNRVDQFINRQRRSFQAVKYLVRRSARKSSDAAILRILNLGAKKLHVRFVRFQPRNNFPAQSFRPVEQTAGFFERLGETVEHGMYQLTRRRNFARRIPKRRHDLAGLRRQ